MVFEYTEAEKQRLIEIEERYAKLQDDLSDEIKKHKEGSKAYNDCLARWIALEDQHNNEISALYAECEQVRFDALGGDLETIYADAEKQVKQIIETTYKQQKEIAIEMNASGAFDKVQNENPLLESGIATESVKQGLHLHLTALEADKGQLDRLNKYIHKYISTSPYVYVDTRRKDAPPEEETAQAIRQPLTPIRTFGFLNDKVDRAIVSAEGVAREINGQMSIILGANQAPAGKPEVPVYLSMLYEGEEIQLEDKKGKRVTAFDNAVYNAVSTLYYYHKQKNGSAPLYITPKEIWQAMNGIRDSRKPLTDKQKKSVCASLDKMRFTKVYMDISNEIKARYITFNDERVTEGHIETYLLNSEKVSFTTEKGNTTTGYRIDNEPILYSYNAAKKHILFVDFDLIDTSDKTGNEGLTIEFKNYLLPQIEMMRNGTRNNNRILYSTIYKNGAIPPPAERLKQREYKTERSYKNAVYQEAKNDRKKISALLESWKEKEYIKDFKPVMKGRAYIGVDIKLPPKQKNNQISAHK